MSDRTLKRLVLLAALILVVGTPVVVIGYLLDQSVDPGPTLAERRLAEVEAAVRENPDDLGLRLTLAVAYRVAARPLDAIGQYDAVLEVEPDSAVALLGKAVVLEEQGDLAGAEPLYQRTVDLRKDGEMAGADTDLERAYLGLGSIAVKQERFADAIAPLEAATRISEADADAWHLLGVAQLGAGAPESAVQAERMAVMFVPTEWGEPYETMAEAYAAQGKPEHAEYARAMVDLVAKRYEQAQERLLPLAEGPAALEAAFGLGLVAEKDGRPEEATDWYHRALELDPDNIGARLALGRLGVKPPGSSGAPAGSPAASPAASNGASG